MITRRGKEVAMLVPASRRSRRSPHEVVEHIRQTRGGAPACPRVTPSGA
jgi:antitoxin (DNA-binding transcriptional repressor) of toxin-antitoxin stability system